MLLIVYIYYLFKDIYCTISLSHICSRIICLSANTIY